MDDKLAYDIKDGEEGVNLIIENYPKGYKFAKLTMPKPKGMMEWIRLIWGFDLWIGIFPIFKLFFLMILLLR